MLTLFATSVVGTTIQADGFRYTLIKTTTTLARAPPPPSSCANVGTRSSWSLELRSASAGELPILPKRSSRPSELRIKKRCAARDGSSCAARHFLCSSTPRGQPPGAKMTSRLLIVAALVALKILGIQLTSIATFGGFFSIAIGLAGRQIAENGFMGLQLIGTTPFEVGERVREARARADLEVLQDGRGEVLANLEL